VKFRTAYDCPVTSSSPVGDRFRTEYIETLDKQGVMQVVACGRTNLQDYIDSFHAECDIYNILRRISNGEIDLLSQKNGSYVDITSIPDNIHDCQRAIVESKNFFNLLPPEIRAQFNNNANEFIASFGSEKFNSIFSETEKTSSEEVITNNESEVKD